jgi:hypothetical protein
MTESLAPFAWVILTLPLLLLMQRWIHTHLHGLAFLLTGNKNWAVAIYAIVLFPGVLLHELSHWLAAKLSGVRTGSFSLLPRAKKDGSIQLGYVEYYKTADLGPIRESFIGAAPLLSGTAVIIAIGYYIFNVPAFVTAVQTGDVDSLMLAVGALFATSDFFFWLYLLFAVSNAMMPSASDRRAWPLFVLILVVVAVILYLVGLREAILTGLMGPVATVFGFLGLAFSLTIAVNLPFIMIIVLLERFLSWAKGVEIMYGAPPQE